MTLSHQIPGAVLTEREHSVPLDHSQPGGERISVFTREVAAPDGGERPHLLFFQGGPGTEAPRLAGPLGGWIERALADYRIILLDQRGTGRSTPVGAIPGQTPEAQAEYLGHFRADSIVRDAEAVRTELGVDRWSVLGQSFGGFCVTAYLSLAPNGLREAFLTGGLPPIGRPVDDVYRATYRRVVERNRLYFQRYPEDRARVRTIHQRLEDGGVELPCGDRLSRRRFRQIGSMLGSTGGAEKLHNLVELATDSPAFAHDVAASTGFERNPLYATLHEACYADGGATRWSAHRLLPDEIGSSDYFTGEHVYPWMFEEYRGLRHHRSAAQLLAEREWPRLYDAAQLAHNEVPVAAAIYVNDMYVEREFSEESARAIAGLQTWVTDQHEHDGLRADGAPILSRLIDLIRGR